MAEDDAIFDPSLMKKKKKKKTPFDLDAAMTTEESVEPEDPSAEMTGSVEFTVAGADAAGNDLDDNLDLESFGKKKKKKKKPFNLDDLDSALAATEGGADGEKGESKEVRGGDDIEGGGFGGDDGMEDDMKIDFSMKKKKKKKKDLTELMEAEDAAREEEKENVDEQSTTWAGSDRDYTYDELLQRVFEIILDKNPDMAAGRKPKFVMRPPQVLRVGTKKTSFANFTEICKTLHRQPKHLLDFLLAELGTSGSVDGNSQLIIKGRFQPKQIENVLRRYIKEYVTCHTCRSPETILQKDTRLFFLQCESCGSRCSVASIKSGFQAVTSKRAAIRAKTA
ncbi:eukaryotic translation initiation factor 2 subunit 2 isoform X2 [Toxorhynchites rutilus septentrionalis]|uniref:eukaryotic translation initiation factor 2 subunit 2 isoform X2 n=1 Tax=Toxorhynchites rutilus septentrionalis TaxID=329112 RepID=UPI00247AAA21|nr:eukaryotic translation initiation factor 2 subunit 2 isoform X2 [Toxorhynchites rutilus septentrionalis]